MKKIQLVLSLLALSLVGFAQKNSGPVKEGSILVYNVFPMGGELQSDLVFERISADTVTIGWTIHSSMRNGRRTMTRASLQTSQMGFWDPPVGGEDLIIPSDQSMLVMSHNVFQQAKTTGRMQFDGLQFIASGKTGDTYTAGSLKLPVIEMADAGNKAKIWILDDPALPIILRYRGNPYGIDLELLGLHL